MKKTILVLATLIGIITSAFTQTNNDADKIIGQYWSPNKDGKIEVYKNGNNYYGKFTWGKNLRKDTKILM